MLAGFASVEIQASKKARARLQQIDLDFLLIAM
jgi:hypothetical protein